MLEDFSQDDYKTAHVINLEISTTEITISNAMFYRFVCDVQIWKCNFSCRKGNFQHDLYLFPSRLKEKNNIFPVL